MPSFTWPPSAARPGRPADDSLHRKRAQIAGLRAIQRIDPAATLSRATFGGLDSIVAQVPDPMLTILYCHGGAFRIGGVDLWSGLVSRLAVAAQARVIVPEYPLAPEFPFPHALESLALSYRDITAGHPDQSIVLAGDSAGGGLATSLALAIAQAGGVQASALLLFSPWLDLTLAGESLATCAATDALFSRTDAEEARDAYLAGAPAEQPLASPLGADIAGLPPTWLCASTSEVLRDDARCLAAKITIAGKQFQLHVEPDLPHVWPIMLPGADATERMIASAAAFARRAIE